ncbi:hypothetical protein, partial [Klebsiella sp. 78179]|uniref:hypothetical protein n=1 Tax=Klebsiella sp. 78179 TaxID=3079090 RepID=UPI003006712C
MMSLWDALRMNMMISYQELVRTFPKMAGSRWNSSYLFVYKPGQPTDLTYLPSQRKTAHSII